VEHFTFLPYILTKNLLIADAFKQVSNMDISKGTHLISLGDKILIKKKKEYSA